MFMIENITDYHIQITFFEQISQTVWKFSNFFTVGEFFQHKLLINGSTVL